MKTTTALAALIIGAAGVGAAHAQGPAYGGYERDGTYVSLSGGGSFLKDARNRGELTEDFTTGAGTTIAPGTTLPAGTRLGWDTDFNTGYMISGAVGKRFGAFRGEAELSFQRNGIDGHDSAFIGSSPLDNQDAGVLTTGSPQTGSTVGEVLADGRGHLRTIYVMANAVYDIDIDAPVTPYIGGGVGVGFVSAEYRPSGLPVADDNSAQFAYQAMAGASYSVSPRADLFAGYRYRGTTKPTLEASLLPADLEFQNRGSVVEAGLRYAF